ncbi:MAG: fibronectin type III domain-containing protein [bacterium]
MSKNQKLWAIVLGIILIIGLIVYLVFYFLNRPAQEKDQYSNWQTYENTIHNYTARFPSNWYLHAQGFQPAPPDAIRFANFEKLSKIPDKFTFVQISVSQTEGIISDLSELDSVKNYISDGYISKNITLDSQKAIKLTKDDTENGNWTIVMAVKAKKIYAFNAVLAENSQKTTLSEILDGILNTFKFSITKQTAKNLGIEKAYATPACSVTDAVYWPGSTTGTKNFTNVQNKMGQSYTPTKSTLCQVRFPVRIHPDDNNTTVWLRVKNQADQIIGTTYTYLKSDQTQISFTFSEPIDVIPGQIYRLFLNSAAGENTLMYYTDPGGYIGGEAYFEGYAELEKDFSFLTRAMSVEIGGEEEEEPTEEDQQPGEEAQQAIEPATTKSGIDVSEFFQIPLDQDAPDKPAKLDLLKLRLTGITESYADLGWTKVEDDELGGYILYRGDASKNYHHYIDTGTANEKTIYQLKPTSKYYFVVKTYDKSGNLSQPSNEVQAETLAQGKTWFWWIWIILAVIFAGIFGTYYYKKKT